MGDFWSNYNNKIQPTEGLKPSQGAKSNYSVTKKSEPDTVSFSGSNNNKPSGFKRAVFALLASIGIIQATAGAAPAQTTMHQPTPPTVVEEEAQDYSEKVEAISYQTPARKANAPALKQNIVVNEEILGETLKDSTNDEAAIKAKQASVEPETIEVVYKQKELAPPIQQEELAPPIQEETVEVIFKDKELAPPIQEEELAPPIQYEDAPTMGTMPTGTPIVAKYACPPMEPPVTILPTEPTTRPGEVVVKYASPPIEPEKPTYIMPTEPTTRPGEVVVKYASPPIEPEKPTHIKPVEPTTRPEPPIAKYAPPPIEIEPEYPTSPDITLPTTRPPEPPVAKYALPPVEPTFVEPEPPIAKYALPPVEPTFVKPEPTTWPAPPQPEVVKYAPPPVVIAEPDPIGEENESLIPTEAIEVEKKLDEENE